MKRLFPIALLPLLAFGLALTGCDSDEDDTPIEERILGTWEVSSASVRVNTGLGTVSVPVLDASDGEAVSIAFDSDARFVFEVTGPIDFDVQGFGTITVLEAGETTTNAGTYAFVENDEQLRFTTTEIDGQTVPASAADVTFELRGGDRLTLIVDNSPEGREVLAFLLGDEVPEEFLDALEGGEATFERAPQVIELDTD